MKKNILSALALGLALFSVSASAQNEIAKEGQKTESQEIIIKKKSDKDIKLTVEINGDKILINGKPLTEFKDDDVTINKRNTMVVRGYGKLSPLDELQGLNWSSNNNGKPSAFLGVVTEKSDNGAIVKEVTAGSAAEKVGLKTGDVITKLGDKKNRWPTNFK